MPTLSELRRRFSAEQLDVETCVQTLGVESLVPDARQGMKSTQILDDKFGAALAREQDGARLRVPKLRRDGRQAF